MNSLFETTSSQSILDRLDKLTPETPAQWGKMDVSQMLKHCQAPLDIALENITLTSKTGWLQKQIMKLFKPLLYNDKPWKQGLPTAKELIIDTPQDFDKEKTRLVLLITEFSKKSTVKTWPNHPLFGYFTPEQWGKMQYKHLDHHLNQFNV